MCANKVVEARPRPIGKTGFSEKGTAHLIAFLLVQRWKQKVSDYSLERKVLYTGTVVLKLGRSQPHGRLVKIHLL